MGGLKVQPMTEVPTLEGTSVFLSASIPDPKRWTGSFDAREITDAVVAASRAVLTVGGTLITAAHPTIAPLLLYVAAEFPPPSGELARVLVYQSALFDRVMPEATQRFAERGVGELRLVPAVPGDAPQPGRWEASLASMRAQMIEETNPAGGIFIGGMEGIREEYALLQKRDPQPRLYPVGRPGGEASRLVERADLPPPLRELLARGDIYPSIFRAVISDLVEHLG